VAAWQDRAYLFVGPSGQGKSTLVAALLDRGWRYLSDEIGAIDAAAGCVHPFPLAPRRRIHDGALLAQDDLVAIRRLPKVDVACTLEAIGREPRPIAGVYFLDFDPGSDSVGERPATPAESVLAMLGNSLALEPDRKREIASLAQLAGRVPCRHLSYPGAEAAAAWVHEAAVAMPQTR
jgi:serine kinase of HPr protein (carbohydrate metabolism regulator)